MSSSVKVHPFIGVAVQACNADLRPRMQIVHETLNGEGESPAATVSYFLDGAHTPESVVTCARWFARAASNDVPPSASSAASVAAALPPTQRVLVFNCTKVLALTSSLSSRGWE